MTMLSFYELRSRDSRTLYRTRWSINPHYITSVHEITIPYAFYPMPLSEIEFEGNAGYRTRSITVNLDVETIERMIQEANKEVPNGIHTKKTTERRKAD